MKYIKVGSGVRLHVGDRSMDVVIGSALHSTFRNFGQAAVLDETSALAVAILGKCCGESFTFHNEGAAVQGLVGHIFREPEGFC